MGLGHAREHVDGLAAQHAESRTTGVAKIMIERVDRGHQPLPPCQPSRSQQDGVKDEEWQYGLAVIDR